MRASLISSPNTGQRTQRTGAGGGQEPELQSSSSLQTERPGSVRSSLMSVLMSLCCEEQAATTRSAALSHMLLHVRASRARTGAVLCNCPNSLGVSHVRAPIIPHGRKRKRRRWSERTRPESVTSNNTRPLVSRLSVVCLSVCRPALKHQRLPVPVHSAAAWSGQPWLQLWPRGKGGGKGKDSVPPTARDGINEHV